MIRLPGQNLAIPQLRLIEPSNSMQLRQRLEHISAH